jgi:hypothetical protein
MKYDLQSALKNIRMEDGGKCPFKYNPPKFDKKKNENESSTEEDKPKEKKFFNKFKKKDKDNGPNPQMNDHEFRDPNRP